LNGLIPYRGQIPCLQPSVFVAEGAKIIGDVEIEEKSSIWFNTVVRGDENYIRVGACTNVQDNSVFARDDEDCTASYRLGCDYWTQRYSPWMHC
jgi:carbonic anhydrase/acetyltransferase-like protein (isoleucine patch superfamily)